MHRRVNVTLPEETLELVDRVTQGGNRSRFIDLAVRHYVEELGRRELRQKLKEGYVRRADRDASLVAEWFPLEEEAWPRGRE